MNTTETATLAQMNDATIARRIREYQSDLADMVEAGDITSEQANEGASDVQDRLVRDGAWS